MKLIRKMTLLAAALALSAAVSAQEDFSMDFDDGFGDEFGDSGGSASPFSIGGEAKIAPRLYVADVSEDEFGDQSVLVDPFLRLNIGYSAGAVELDGKLAVSKSIVTDYREDILNELTVRVYLGDFILEGGKEKIVWGKGDKIHVLDNFNANDYTDYIIPDYIDRRLAEPMLRLIYNSPTASNLRIEGVWTPVMTPDRLGAGRWQPQTAVTLTDGVMQIADSVLAAMHTAQCGGDNCSCGGISASGLSRISSLADDLYPDVRKLKYGQAGLRVTGTVGMFDIGASYYYGHYKTPSVDKSKMQSYVQRYLTGADLSDDDKFLAYDRLQVFGLEAGGVIGPFNTRAELAYYLTDDTAGDDPAVKNNSLNWVAGFDVDLPVHNINVNIQNIGSVILHHGDIDDNPYDTEYDADGIYSNNKLLLNISDSFAHEKVKPEVTVLYGIERSDLVIQPKITYSVKPGFELSAQGMVLMNLDEDEKSEFQPWVQNNNSFVQVGVKYSF